MKPSAPEVLVAPRAVLLVDGRCSSCGSCSCQVPAAAAAVLGGPLLRGRAVALVRLLELFGGSRSLSCGLVACAARAPRGSAVRRRVARAARGSRGWLRARARLAARLEVL